MNTRNVAINTLEPFKVTDLVDGKTYLLQCRPFSELIISDTVPSNDLKGERNSMFTVEKKAGNDVYIKVFKTPSYLIIRELNLPKSNPIVENLDISNFDPDSISYFCTVPQVDEMPETVRLATDLSVSMHTPLIGKNDNSEEIRVSQEYTDKFRDAGFAIQHGQMHLCLKNSFLIQNLNMQLRGAYGYQINNYFFTPNYRVTQFEGREQRLNKLEEQNDIDMWTRKDHTHSYMFRAGTIFDEDCYFYSGIDMGAYYNPNDKRRRSYMNLGNSGVFWFIPATMYEVELVAKNSDEIVFVNHVFTTTPGNEGDSCTDEYFYGNWNEAHWANYQDDYIQAEHDSLEKTYTGQTFSGYTTIGQYGSGMWDNYQWGLDDADDRNSEAPYREVRQPYELVDIYQQVEDSNGHIGYCHSTWHDYRNTESGYQNQPDEFVDQNETVFKTLIPVPHEETRETWENTGDFKWTFNLYLAPREHCDEQDKIAYRAYELVHTQDSNLIQWTMEAGEEDDSFTGFTSNQPNEVHWAYNNYSAEWYQVESNGDTFYVIAQDLIDYGNMQNPPEIGDYVPEGVGLFRNMNWPDGYDHDAGNEEATFTTDTTETALIYTGNYEFIYNGNVDNDAEPYFSDNNFGIFENNDGTYTKITNAYQWDCISAYYQPDRQVQVFTAMSQKFNTPNEIPIGAEDWAPDGNLLWWITQAWEVEDEYGQKGWTGIPPEGAQPNELDYSQFEGDDISMPWIQPTFLNGGEYHDEQHWTYTGNYDPDFMGRWTKFQNGQLWEE